MSSLHSFTCTYVISGDNHMIPDNQLLCSSLNDTILLVLDKKPLRLPLTHLLVLFLTSSRLGNHFQMFIFISTEQCSSHPPRKKFLYSIDENHYRKLQVIKLWRTCDLVMLRPNPFIYYSTPVPKALDSTACIP